MATFRTSTVLITVLQILSQMIEIQGNTSTSTQEPPLTKTLWNATWTDKLKRDLLLNYDKFARPAQHTNTTTVQLDLTVRHIELEELQGIMTVHGWVRMVWNDEKLRWNETDYGGLAVLHLADHEIWQPDIVLYNSATGTSVDHYGNTHCLAHPDGTVLWVPPAQFLVFCELNLLLWPFDTQVCSLKLGSWTYDGLQIDLQLDSQGTEIELLAANTEWQLLSVTETRNVRHYSCCTEPYIDITHTLTVKRRSPTYSAIVITPATVIVLMTLIVFWLPASAGEKLIIGGCTAIVICLFLLYFAQKLPAMAGNTPLVVLFYSSSLYLVCISMMISVLVINLGRQQHYIAIPWPVKKLLTGWLGRALGLAPLIAQVSAGSLHRGMLTSGNGDESRLEHQPVVFDELNPSGTGSAEDRQNILEKKSSHIAANHAEWTLLATAIDRIAFIIYCLLFAILALVYSI